MTEGTNRLKRWIFGMAILEAVLGAIMYEMGGDATTNPRFLFLLFVVVVNLPGVMVASGLGLFGHDAWGQDGHPMPGWAVVFGVSLVFYTCLIWMIHAVLDRKRNRSEHKAERDGSDAGQVF